MTTNYNRGRTFEWKVRDALTADGYTVIRSAGSKTKADLICFKPGQVLLIQCKRHGGALPPAERHELLRLAALLPGVALPVMAYQPAPRRPIAYAVLTGPGPRERRAWVPDQVGAT